jgi:hypothetical protein
LRFCKPSIERLIDGRTAIASVEVYPANISERTAATSTRWPLFFYWLHDNLLPRRFLRDVIVAATSDDFSIFERAGGGAVAIGFLPESCQSRLLLAGKKIEYQYLFAWQSLPVRRSKPHNVL